MRHRTLLRSCLLLSVAGLAFWSIGRAAENPRRDDPSKASGDKSATGVKARPKPLQPRRDFLESLGKLSEDGIRVRTAADTPVKTLRLNVPQFEADRQQFLRKLTRIEDGDPFVVIDGSEQYESTPLNHTELLQQATARELMVLPRLPDLEVKHLTERCLMIVDREVVEDEDRTTGHGHWTFGHLMTQMANRAATGIEPATFVRRWLAHWETAQTINSFVVPDRAQKIRDVIIKPWEDKSGGAGKPLDLTQAPFRLLAIVNRLDLRSNLVLGESRIGDGGAGEARFVFGAIDATKADRPPLPFTVIFEYQIKRKNFEDVRKWAKQWEELKTLRPGSFGYNRALQQITDQLAGVDADPEAPPNRSALGQLRTNEIALGDVWELREFRIDVQNTGYLKQVTVKQTPNDNGPQGQPNQGFNNKAVLAQFANARRDDLLARDHRIPVEFPHGTPFLGGSAPTPPDFFWKAPDIDPLQARHLLSLATCNGCHAREAFPDFAPSGGPDLLTDPSRVPNHFTHVRPRKAGEAARLSSFLTGKEPNGQDFCLKDPVDQPRDNTHLECQQGPAKHRRFRDLINRAYDFNGLVQEGAAFEFFRKPLKNRVH